MLDNLNMNEIKLINLIIEIHMNKKSSKKEDMKKKEVGLIPLPIKTISTELNSFLLDIL